MTNVSSYSLTSTYQEDISPAAAGTEIIGHPCTIWDVTVCLEDAIVAVVNFSNSTTAYDNAKRCGKVVISGPDTKHFTFSKGMPCSEGLCATSNQSSVDVRVGWE